MDDREVPHRGEQPRPEGPSLRMGLFLGDDLSLVPVRERVNLPQLPSESMICMMPSRAAGLGR